MFTCQRELFYSSLNEGNVMENNDLEIVKEILEKCSEKKIRVQFILRINMKDMGVDYFIAPPIEDVGGIICGGRKGYGYNCKTKKLKKCSMGSADLEYNSDKYIEVYRDKDDPFSGLLKKI